MRGTLHVRISYANLHENLAEAMENMERALRKA
jgi:aspartate/methionine/tyrosine aminotransferase